MLKTYNYLQFLCLFFLIIIFETACTKNSAKSKPNIIFILADDMGYGDAGCYNPDSKIPTPNIDELASRGILFSDAHTPSSVCSPTRYGLLTGRYCWRTWLKEGVLDGVSPPLIEENRITVASLLKEKGYQTACIGKWHLGMQWHDQSGQPIGHQPLDKWSLFRNAENVDFSREITSGPLTCGFDYFYGISASLDMAPYCFIDNNKAIGKIDSVSPENKSLFMNQVEGMTASDFKLEDVMPQTKDKAVEFISRFGSGKDEKPFFLYLPISAPHLPVVPNKRFIGTSKAGLYGDFVVEVDDFVGSIMQALKENGIDRNTLVLFSSDNGGLWHYWEFQEQDDIAYGAVSNRGAFVEQFNHPSNGELRGTKADIWEGGHRVPFIASWPAKIAPGQKNDQLVCLTDFLATCAKIVGTELPAGAGEDSYNISSISQIDDDNPRESLVMHSLRGMFSIRKGDWKLVEERGSGGFSSPRVLKNADDGPEGQLYNLKEDFHEAKNVYDQYPEIVEELSRLLEKYKNDERSVLIKRKL